MIAYTKKLPSFKRELQSDVQRRSKSVETARPVGTPLDATQLRQVVGGASTALPVRGW